MKGEEGSWWLQEIPEYFHFARVHVGDPYRVLRNPPQCFSLAPEAERRFCEFCYGIYILHAIPALSRSEFIVANITFAFACTTNPACFEPSPFKTEIYPRIILAFSLNHFWRGVMFHIPATNETYKRDTVKKKKEKDWDIRDSSIVSRFSPRRSINSFFYFLFKTDILKCQCYIT